MSQECWDGVKYCLDRDVRSLWFLFSLVHKLTVFNTDSQTENGAGKVGLDYSMSRWYGGLNNEALRGAKPLEVWEGVDGGILSRSRVGVCVWKSSRNYSVAKFGFGGILPIYMSETIAQPVENK